MSSAVEPRQARRSWVLVPAAIGALAAGWASAAHADAARDLTALEGELAVAEGELSRVDAEYGTVPDLFSDGDRADRLTWGEIYYLQKEYQRASLLLYGAVEPHGNDKSPIESQPDYPDALYFLADSLYQLGNYTASQNYFERLLKIKGHQHHAQAILRLMAIVDSEGRYSDVERYYDDYLAVAGNDVPGQVRYLHGKTLVLAKKDDLALAELAKVPRTDAYALRSRYLMGAVLVRQDKLDDALQMFTQTASAKPIAKDDKKVKEMANLARGRIFYEQDKLGESIDAYQEIPYDSEQLNTMLYEVTWTYVRRGQLELHGRKGDNLTDLQRREKAKVEYEKALRQLDDLRALEPEGARDAEIDILAGNLRLQRNEFDKAGDLFDDVLYRHKAADDQLDALLADRSTRDRLLQDILATGQGGLSVDSKLPPLAARKAANNEDVAKALHVFKDIQKSKEEIQSTTKLLAQLEDQLSPDNPSRAELFGPLQSGVLRSTSLANTLSGLKARAVLVERAVARPAPEVEQQLIVVRTERQALEQKILSLPRTPDALQKRKTKLLERYTAIDQALHQAELEVRQRRAELTAVDFMLAKDQSQELGAQSSPLKVELRKNQVRQQKTEVERLERRVVELHDAVGAVKRSLSTLGGRGSADEKLRDAYASSFQAERELLAKARDPQQQALYDRIDQDVRKLDELADKNREFRTRLDQSVSQRLEGVRALIGAQKDALTAYLSTLGDIDARATAVRDKATLLALQKVKTELSRIVLRADVGIVDTSFAKKQAETEKIGQLQRAKSAELTDLTQAFADLTKDELP